MRVVIDCRKAFDAGIGTYIRALVPRVVERLRMQAAALVPAGEGPQHDYLDRVPVDRVEVQAAPLSIREQWSLRRCLRSGDVFWATSLAHPLWTRHTLLATVHDVAQLALPHDEIGITKPVRWAAATFLESLRRRSSALFMPSEFTQQEWLRLVGPAARCQVQVTPLAVGPQWLELSESARAAGKPYFVCVGSVRPHKNIARLVQAFGQISARIPHDLIVAGRLGTSGDEGRWVQALPTAAHQRVRFVGALADQALKELVAGADALVFPSLYEGFGLPALEAMAAGCPVLAARAGSLPEVCADAATYFDPRSSESISSALLEHARLDARERRAMSGRGRARARAFSWDRTADLTAQVIADALNDQSRPE